jgi:hypothetical protein
LKSNYLITHLVSLVNAPEVTALLLPASQASIALDFVSLIVVLALVVVVGIPVPLNVAVHSQVYSF